MDQPQFIAYYRKSVQEGVRSNLFLEPQIESVKAFVTRCGGVVLKSYIELEKSRHQYRPELSKALEECTSRACTLVIGKVGRLSSKKLFLAKLLDSGVDFYCAEIPEINSTMLPSLELPNAGALIVERENMFTQRETVRRQQMYDKLRLDPETKAARRAAREEIRTNERDTYNQQVKPIIIEIQAAGVMRLHDIAHVLNERGIYAKEGGPWSSKQVWRVLKGKRA